MVALTEDFGRKFQATGRDVILRHPYIASTVFYKGAGVCVLALNGAVRPVVQSLTDPIFVGYADESGASIAADGGGINVRMQGLLWVPAGDIVGATDEDDIYDGADSAAPVYMLDDGTGFTLTALNNVLCGSLCAYDSDADEFCVSFKGGGMIGR